MNEYENMLMMLAARCGNTRRGSRIPNASKVDKLMVPKIVVSACPRAADTTSVDDGAGTAFRWKYHCDTVAAVVPR